VRIIAQRSFRPFEKPLEKWAGTTKGWCLIPVEGQEERINTVEYTGQTNTNPTIYAEHYFHHHSCFHSLSVL
jgi:hypothetical protein